jgi:hypothetical protein
MSDAVDLIAHHRAGTQDQDDEGEEENSPSAAKEPGEHRFLLESPIVSVPAALNIGSGFTWCNAMRR